MRKNSIKNTIINSEVRKELQMIIQNEIKDPRVSPWTSVVSVEVAPDLKTCKVYISCLGDDAACEETVKGLKSAASFIRRRLAATVNLRNTPELRFFADQSIAYGVRMSHLIDEVTKDLPKDVEEEVDPFAVEDEVFDDEDFLDEEEI